jgi:amidase
MIVNTGIQYAELSLSSIRNFRAHGQSQNHIFKIMHRGYTGKINSGEDSRGAEKCPFEFYQNWVNNPQLAREQSEKLTRKTPGTSECPIDGIPN